MRSEPSRDEHPRRAGRDRLLGAALVLGVGGAGTWVGSCSAKNVVVDVPIVAYVPASCGDATGAQVTYAGVGDFPQPTQAAEAVTLGTSGVALTALPTATREVVISPVSPDAGAWAGTALVPDSGSVEVLTLPFDRACTLSVSPMLAGVPGVSAGMISGTQAMLVGGPSPPFLIDLGTGKVTQFAAALEPARSDATITPFGRGALIAGGKTSGDQGLPTALVYTPGPGGSLGSFGNQENPIQLPSNQRQQHAAVALADGRVLLIGGVTDQGQAVVGIDAFDPSNPTDPRFLAATLHAGRIQPTAFTLPNGQVFIGGGLDPTKMTPVATVEWLDASLHWLGEQALCVDGAASSQPSFAPTEGGAVLAVFAGPTSATCSNVQLVRPFGLGVQRAPPITPAPTSVILLEGAEASPLLISGSTVSRWNPWTTAFTPFASTGISNPSLTSPTYFSTSSAGLALWLGEDGNVWTLRFDTHGEYATDTLHGPYLDTDDEFTAPDRLLDAGFGAGSGALLSNGTTVWVTDETFAGVTASVTLPNGGAATLVLRDPAGREVTCGATGVPATGTVQVTRSGASVSALSNGSAMPCAGTLDAGARVAVGVRGPDGGTTAVRGLAVER